MPSGFDINRSVSEPLLVDPSRSPGMSSDIEFLRQRLAQVEQQIAHPSPYQSQGKDKGRLRHAYHTRQNTTYQREARLLRKLLARARPGHVLQLMTSWRQQSGQFTVDYRREHKETIRAYDEWSQLPRHIQAREPEPPRPPAQRNVVEPARLLTAQEVAERVCAHFGCDHESHLTVAEKVV